MLVLVWMLGCAKPCEYVARCDGEVLQTCSLGVDQLFGSGESEVACPTTVNPHCVELEVDHAFCARTEEPSCTADEAFCDGDEAVTCNADGFEVALDCTAGQRGPTCVVSPDAEAVCGLSPVAPCDNSAFEQRCDGEQVVACLDGVEALLTCTDGKVCRTGGNGAGCVDE